MHESERRDAAAVAEKHELEVTGLRGTIEELETKLAKVSQDLNIDTNQILPFCFCFLARSPDRLPFFQTF